MVMTSSRFADCLDSRGLTTHGTAPTLAPALPMGQAAEHLKVKLRPDLIVQPQFTRA